MSCPPTSHTVNEMFLYSTVSTLKPEMRERKREIMFSAKKKRVLFNKKYVCFFFFFFVGKKMPSKRLEEKRKCPPVLPETSGHESKRRAKNHASRRRRRRRRRGEGGALTRRAKNVPIVGIVVTISPSLSLYKMVVLPAASRPTCVRFSASMMREESLRSVQ